MKVCLEIKMLTTFFAFVVAILNTVNAELFLKPRDTEAMVGDSTYFDCASNINKNDINWYHYKLGAKDHEDVCIYCMRKVHPQYRDRIQIERHNDTGSTRLKIKPVRLEDAGVYICQDNGGIGESTSAQLVVLESSPTCTSNIKPDGFIGPNSCNIEPDELHLSCSVSYNGNIPPIIQWKEINAEDPVKTGLSCQHNVNRMTCNLTMKTDLSLNGSSYICATNRSVMTQYNCNSDTIRIIYAKTDKSTVEMVLGSGEKVICSANSSQACSYTWQWFNGVVEEDVSNDAVLTPWKMGWHKCEANCNIRGKQCTVLSRLVQVVPAQGECMLDCVIKKWLIAASIATAAGVFPLLMFLIYVRCRVSSSEEQPLLTDTNELEMTRPPTDNLKTNTEELEMIRLLPDNLKTNTDELEMTRLLPDNLKTNTGELEMIRLLPDNLKSNTDELEMIRLLPDNLKTNTDELEMIRLLPDNLKSNTDELEMKSLNSSFANGKAIYGLAILEKEVFVVRKSSNKVEVYDVTTFILKREWNLEELNDPQDIASCNSNQCLYIAEKSQILRVDPKGNGSLINKWSTGDRFGLLSVTHEGNILVVVNCQINEYSPEGELLSEINLSALGIYHPRHAVRLTDKRIIISLSSTGESPQGILIYSDKSVNLLLGILEEHQGERPNVPAHMCVKNNGSILAIDEGHKRIIQLNTELDFQKELISSKDGLSYPFRICLDGSNGILLVANNSLDFDAPQNNGEILAFTLSQTP